MPEALARTPPMYIVGVLPRRLLCTRHLVNTLHLVSPSPVSQCFPRPRTCRPCPLACPPPLVARPLATSLPAAPLRTPEPSPPAAPPHPLPARSPGSQSSPVTGTSPAVAAVLGEATFSRLCKSGIHLFGRRYEVEAYEEARPDAFCNRCSRWGHIAPHCSADPRCSICAEDYTTQNHWCSVEGCRAGRGRGCPHETAKCANCKGPHWARAEACAAKKEARQLAWRWKSPPRPRREWAWRGTAPKRLEDETPVASEGGEEVEAEVEERIEPSAEEMEE